MTLVDSNVLIDILPATRSGSTGRKQLWIAALLQAGYLSTKLYSARSTGEAQLWSE